MNSKYRGKIVSLILATVGATMPLSGTAQQSGNETSAASAGAGTIEEVMVTARRREESLQDVPISISVFDASTIDQLTLRNVGDVASFTPNMSRSSGPTGHNDGFYFIRGVGNVDLNPATDPGVATYIDGVYMGRITGASMDTLNIERVEILRGPQGTLFGRNTIGGAVNITTRSPTEEVGFEGRLTVGEDGRLDYGASINLPLGETFGAIVSYLHQERDGPGKNVYSGKTFGDIDNDAVFGRVVWRPNENFSASLSFDYSEQGGTSTHTVLNNFNPLAVSPLGVPMPPDLGDDRSTDLFKNFHSVDPVHDGEVQGGNLTLEWDLGPATVKSITAYRELEQVDANDFDSSGYVFYDHSFTTEQDQFSQELQLLGDSFDDRLHWVLGGYYFDEDAYHNNRIAMGGNNGVPPGIPGVPYATRGVNRAIYNNQAFDVAIKSKALFAHLTWDLGKSVSAVLGVRYTDEEKVQKYRFFIDNSANVFNFAGLPPIPYLPTLNPDNPTLTIPTTYKESWTETTPKVGMDWRVNDNTLLYVSYAEGFRSGGFNGRPTPNQTGQFAPVQAYDPEYNDTYELGWKMQSGDNRFRFNGALFYSDYKDIQLLVLGSSGFFETQNAAKAEIKGFELELLAAPVDGLLLNAGLGYLDTEYARLDPGSLASGILPSNVLPNSPEWTLNLGAQFRIGLSGGSGIILRGDYSWQDEVFFNATNLPGEFQDSYGLLSLRASWVSADEQWEIAAYGQNVADEEYLTNGQDVTGPLGVSFANVGTPRELGVQVIFRSR